jgi:hypothetical protein
MWRDVTMYTFMIIVQFEGWISTQPLKDMVTVVAMVVPFHEHDAPEKCPGEIKLGILYQEKQSGRYISVFKDRISILVRFVN